MEAGDLCDADLYGPLFHCVTQVIADELYPELGSDRARSQARDVISVLGRLISQIEHSAALAGRHADRWADLAGDAPIERSARASEGSGAANLSAIDAGLRRVIESRGPNGAQPADWLDAVTEDLHAYCRQLRETVPRTPVRTDRGEPHELDGLTDKLAAYLRARFPALPADPVVSMNPLQGGRTKLTATFALRPNECIPTALVLRMDYRSHTGTRCSDEFPLLRALFAAGVPVPEPILAEHDPSHLGGAFVIMREVTDAEPGGEPFPEQNDGRHFSPELGRDLARAMAKTHQLPLSAAGELPAAQDTGAMLDKYLETWRASDRTANPLIAETGFAWLRSHPLPPDRPVSVVHADIGSHNILVSDRRLAALLDWELAHVGDPAEDLGYAKLWLIDELLPWAEFVEEYVAAGGDPTACDPLAVSYFSIWASVRNLVLVASLRGLVKSKEVLDIESLRTVIDQGAWVQEYLTRALRSPLATPGSR